MTNEGYAEKLYKIPILCNPIVENSDFVNPNLDFVYVDSRANTKNRNPGYNDVRSSPCMKFYMIYAAFFLCQMQ